jgi:hypothetical protein
MTPPQTQTQTQTQTLGTLAARRAQAQAALEAADAQTRAAHAQLEAQAAEQEAGRREALARTAEIGSEWDRLDAFLAAERERERREWNEQYDRRQETMRQLHDLATMELPHVPRSLEEHQAEVARLDAYVDREVQAERDEQRAYIDQAESRRRWDWQFRARYDFHHPGGANRCDCRPHRIWRGEE